MTKLSKKQKLWGEAIAAKDQYDLDEALGLVIKFAQCKFKETVECSFSLGIDGSKTDQLVRGVSILPHGLGKDIRVAVFADDELAEKAKSAGADIVGFEDLAEKIKAGQIDFDIVIATPASMRVVGQLGQILGPKGLMPNPKVGTVTADVEQAVKNAKSGQVNFRSDKSGIINCSIGKVNFSPDNLKENFTQLYEDISRAKPSNSKGAFFRKLTLSSTMGPGVPVDISSVQQTST